MEGEAAIRFIDPVVFSICLPLWDTDGDGYISEAEAKVVRRLTQGAFNNQEGIISLDDLDKLAGYIYHAGNFNNIPNLITATTGLKIDLTSGFRNLKCKLRKLSEIRANKDKCNQHQYQMVLLKNDVSLRTVIFGGNETMIGNFYGVYFT